MKKILQLSTVFALILILGANAFAQTESRGDTLVIGPLNSEDQPVGALNEAIHGDTTDTGERVHSVYKLHRGQQYILTETLEADFPLVIVADEPDDNNHPPVIRAGVLEDGSNVAPLYRAFDDVSFKNLWITGVTAEGSGGISWILNEDHGSGKTVSFEGLIVEYPFTGWATFWDLGGQNVYKVNDCVFMNIGSHGATWSGAIWTGEGRDSTMIRNTTFFNFGAFAGYNGNGTFYTELDHNTFVNSMVHPVESHQHVIKKYSNNLFVNTHAFSDDDDEIARHFDQEVKGIMNYAEIQWDPQRLDSLFGPGGEYGKTYDPNGDGELTEDELVWELKSNAWWYTEPITSYWDDFADAPYNVVPNPWMNNYNQAMFENQDDTWTWEVWTYEWPEDDEGEPDYEQDPIDSTLVEVEHEPYQFFVEENTMNVDPGFVDMNGTDVLLGEAARKIRREWEGEEVTHPNWHGVDDYLDFSGRWPLDFDLSYSNAELQSAGTDGLPVGDLNWFPDKRDEYATSVDDTESGSLPEKFSLSSAYPNPFNPVTRIQYEIPEASDVRLEVYNLIGQRVDVLVDGFRQGGTHNVQFDGTGLASGVYIYRLQAGNYNAVKKMTIVK